MSERKNVNEQGLFLYLFGNEYDSKPARELCNALLGEEWDDETKITKTVFEGGVLSIEMDSHFIVQIGNAVSLESSGQEANPLIPYIMLRNVGRINPIRYYEVEEEKETIKIPEIRFFSLVDLDENWDERNLIIGDQSESLEKSGISLCVKQLNMGKEHNEELKQKCAYLRDYTFLVQRILDYINEGKTIRRAVTISIAELPKESETKSFLRYNLWRVKDILENEYLQRLKKADKRFKREEYPYDSDFYNTRRNFYRDLLEIDNDDPF